MARRRRRFLPWKPDLPVFISSRVSLSALASRSIAHGTWQAAAVPVTTHEAGVETRRRLERVARLATSSLACRVGVLAGWRRAPAGSVALATMEDEESRDVVADLQSELEEREHQLQMAAEFGQGLVEKNSALEEENDELRQENAACLAKVEETEWRFRELEATVARLNEMLQEKQVALERAEGELEAQAELMRQVDATASKLADAHASHAPDADASAAAVGAVDAVGAAAAAEGKAQRKQQLDTEAEQAILEETERRLQAEQSAMKLRQTLERREEELSNRDAKVAEAVAERDELSEKTVAERERCRALQVRLAEMERQLMAAIATSEASTAASGAHTLDMSLAGAAADDSIAGPSLLDEVQDGSTLQLELEDAEMAQPTPRVPRVNSPQRSRAIASPVVAATVEQLKQPPPQPAPPSRETIALQGMLAAVQRSQQQAESLVATENAQEWEGLSELFAAALNLNLTDEYGISIMKRNIERGTHTINHFMDLISGWLEKWAEEEAEKRRQKQKHDGKWAELEELCVLRCSRFRDSCCFHVPVHLQHVPIALEILAAPVLSCELNRIRVAACAGGKWRRSWI